MDNLKPPKKNHHIYHGGKVKIPQGEIYRRKREINSERKLARRHTIVFEGYICIS